MARVNELRMIARIAQMYYVDGKRQSDIAKHLRISQATVSRMLKRGQEENIIRTSIVTPAGFYSELESQIRSKYDLKEAIVVDCSEDSDGAIMARIGEAAAHLFETTLHPDEIIGVSSWSETLLKMVDNIHPSKTRKARHVVQILGGMGDPSVQSHANQLTTRLAKLTGAETNLLIAPGVAQSREAKLVLLSDTYVRETMNMFGKITLAIIGIGALEPSHLLARSGNVFSSRELTEIANAGGIGEIGLRFFDKNGKLVKTPFDDRVIGLTFDELSQIDRVVALAGGQTKTETIRGALHTGVVDFLITDKFTARRLVET